MFTDQEIIDMPVIQLAKMWEWEEIRLATLRIIEEMDSQ